MIIPVPWRWLDSTATLQRDTYGFDIGNLAGQSVVVDARNYYMLWNCFAAMVELAEMSVEFSWAPWATDEPFANRDRIRDEGVDVLHFVGNILAEVGVTDDELEAAYQAKQEKNRRRQASGRYSKVKGGLGEGSEHE